jgi:hypothetical protein
MHELSDVPKRLLRLVHVHTHVNAETDASLPSTLCTWKHGFHTSTFRECARGWIPRVLRAPSPALHTRPATPLRIPHMPQLAVTTPEEWKEQQYQQEGLLQLDGEDIRVGTAHSAGNSKPQRTRTRRAHDATIRPSGRRVGREGDVVAATDADVLVDPPGTADTHAACRIAPSRPPAHLGRAVPVAWTHRVTGCPTRVVMP